MKRSFKAFVNRLLRHFGIEIRSVYSGGRLFPESFYHLKRVLPALADKPMTVIDVGVAEGTPDLWRTFPPTQYRYLLIEANPLYANHMDVIGKEMHAIVEKVFCGDHDGKEKFVTRTAADAGKASKYDRKTESGGARTTIPCLTLDTIVKRHALSGPYILKIDVEGAELDVLRGATETLKSTEALIIEAPIILRKAEGASFGAIVHYIHELGFAVFDISEMSYHRKSGFLNLTNLVFVRKDNKKWEYESVLKK